MVCQDILTLLTNNHRCTFKYVVFRISTRMGTLLIVRHGESVWNAEGRIQGHTDIGLSDKGAEQARLLGKRLAQLPIDVAYCSDLIRASETAKLALGSRDIVLNETPRLREYDKGSFEGLTLPEIESRFPDDYPRYLEKNLDYAPEEGETTRGVSARMAKFFDEIRARHLNETVLVIGHGGSLRAAMVSLLGLPLEGNWSFVFGNCGLTMVDTYSDNAVLRLFNDTSHLNGMTGG